MSVCYHETEAGEILPYRNERACAKYLYEHLMIADEDVISRVDQPWTDELYRKVIDYREKGHTFV